MFVYAGCFVLHTEGLEPREHDVDTDGPVLVVCPSGVASSFESSRGTEVRVFSVFAPPFEVGESEYVEP
jgi:hypothetical protein